MFDNRAVFTTLIKESIVNQVGASLRIQFIMAVIAYPAEDHLIPPVSSEDRASMRFGSVGGGKENEGQDINPT